MRNERTFQVKFLNGVGGGFMSNRTVVDGTTIVEFFTEQYPGEQARKYVITVNGDNVPPAYQLQAGDNISVVPANVKGA